MVKWIQTKTINGKRWKLFKTSNTKHNAKRIGTIIRKNRGYNARILYSKKGKENPICNSPVLYKYGIYYRKSKKRKTKIYVSGKGWS